MTPTPTPTIAAQIEALAEPSRFSSTVRNEIARLVRDNLPAIVTALRQAEGGAEYPSLELCVQFSEDGQHIRKWSRLPFDGGTSLYSHPAPNPQAEGEASVVRAYLKEWQDNGEPRSRVDLREYCEPWLEAVGPTITPLVALARQHGAREDGWRGIDSAPKDGTEVDLFGYPIEASTKPVRITDCHYHCGEWLRWGYFEDEEGSHERIYRPLFWMHPPPPPRQPMRGEK